MRLVESATAIITVMTMMTAFAVRACEVVGPCGLKRVRNMITVTSTNEQTTRNREATVNPLSAR